MGSFRFPSNAVLYKKGTGNCARVQRSRIACTSCGSGIERIYKEADARVKAVIAEAGSLTEQYQKALLAPSGDEVTVFNSLSFPRRVLVKLPGPMSIVYVPGRYR